MRTPASVGSATGARPAHEVDGAVPAPGNPAVGLSEHRRSADELIPMGYLDNHVPQCVSRTKKGIACTARPVEGDVYCQGHLTQQARDAEREAEEKALAADSEPPAGATPLDPTAWGR